jgi:hypothetical protein
MSTRRRKEFVGSLVVGYSEIEFGLLGCIGAYLRQNMDVSARILFRVPGEGGRIQVADAILRPAFTEVGLAGEWGNALGAVRYCKNNRNQYAHCHWMNHDKFGLCFINLDAAASSIEGTANVTLRPINLELLEKQMAYFEYAVTWLVYLNGEYQHLTGQPAEMRCDAPKSIERPPFYN